MSQAVIASQIPQVKVVKETDDHRCTGPGAQVHTMSFCQRFRDWNYDGRCISIARTVGWRLVMQRLPMSAKLAAIGRLAWRDPNLVILATTLNPGYTCRADEIFKSNASIPDG